MEDNNSVKNPEWILIGEVDWEGRNPFGTGNIDSEPWFLYTRSLKDGNFQYAFSRGIGSVGFYDNFIMDKRYSINTILCMYISMDRDHGRLDDGRHLVTKAEGFKIRLAGNTDWIEVDQEFLEGRKTISKLEAKFRTNRETKWVESIRSNTSDPEIKNKLKDFKIEL